MSDFIVCPSCHAQVPQEHRFCGRCGHAMKGTAPAAATAADPAAVKTAFFGAMQSLGKAKLILIRGEGMDGVSYHLNAAEHIAGRKAGAILFPEDNYLSPRHANFFYDQGRLFVRDEGALNGIFIRIRQPAELEDGDVFLAGEELLRVETRDLGGDTVGPDHTHFFASPRPSRAHRIVQLFEGGRSGLVCFPREETVTIGREHCHINFPNDRFISGRHCRVDFSGTTALLTDMQSRNGTYVRIKGQRELVHGDYLFLGRQLLRVEITTM
jgi:pSer/pThr/pTyr-binding forkhead associated (FHA) protein